MNNDEELWLGLMHGDKEMLVALYQQYYHSLFFIGLKQHKDASLVKDAIHELFLYLWEKRETLQPARNIKNYLVTSLLRKLAADCKKSPKNGALHIVWIDSMKDTHPNPEEKLVSKEQCMHLSKLLTAQINELPGRQKELIVLKYYEGLAYEDIVQRTGLSHRTVYNKIHEGLKRLKSNLVKGRSARAEVLDSQPFL
ncbi:MAG: sigma-70 family RNA polymerase sigma factor [Ferruginibacter sp.]|jgi:RNA polymerase sigma factor (sigma-70 family)